MGCGQSSFALDSDLRRVDADLGAVRREVRQLREEVRHTPPPPRGFAPYPISGVGPSARG